ncbi:MAG: hypothetical protein AABY22_08665 [Nanoarchaeota archaeon]
MIEQNNIIIGLSGKSGVGKTTAAAYLMQKYDFKMVAFADKLKELSGELFPFTLEQLHGQLKETPYKNYSWTPRDFMIKFGQFMRYWDENFWIRNTFLDAQLNNIAIHDVRYLNEVEYLKSKNAKIVRINRYVKNRPYRNSDDESETQLDSYKFDFVIPEMANDTLSDLYKSLDYMLTKFGYV